MEASTPSPGTGGHEFGPDENAVIGNAGRWIGYWSWIAMLSGVLLAIGGLVGRSDDRFGAVILGGVYVLVGWYFRGAAQSMNEVVSTTGNDVTHLVAALDRLASAFKVMVLLVVIGVVLALLVGLFAGMGAAPGD